MSDADVYKQLYALGMPQNRKTFRVEIPGEGRFKNHEAQLLGVVLPINFAPNRLKEIIQNPKQTLTTEGTIYKSLPQFLPDGSLVPGSFFFGREQGVDSLIGIWRATLWVKSNPSIYVQDLWHPSLGWERTIRGIPIQITPETSTLLKQLVDGLGLLVLAMAPKPTREDAVSKADFRIWVLGAARKLAKQERQVSKTALARELLMDRDTVSKYLNRDLSLLSEAQIEWGKVRESNL